jgi:hypothetical protein
MRLMLCLQSRPFCRKHVACKPSQRRDFFHVAGCNWPHERGVWGTDHFAEDNDRATRLEFFDLSGFFNYHSELKYIAFHLPLKPSVLSMADPTADPTAEPTADPAAPTEDLVLQMQLWVIETTKVIDNYQIIIDEAKVLDNEQTSPYTSKIHAICNSYFTIFLDEASEKTKKLEDAPNDITNSMVTTINELMNKVQTMNLATTVLDPSEHRSPIILLLKLAEEKGDVFFTEGQPQEKTAKKHDWGRLASLKTYLKKLCLKSIPNDGPPYWPGIPSCIMALHTEWDDIGVVISTTVDKYLVSTNLYGGATKHRQNMLAAFQGNYSGEVRTRVDAVEHLSDEIISQTENDKGYTTEELQQLLSEVNSDTRIPVNIPGLVATWAPNSGYKAACLLDSCRFHAEKPPAAVKREGDAKRRKVYNSTGCAEWAGYVDLAGRNCPTSADSW